MIRSRSSTGTRGGRLLPARSLVLVAVAGTLALTAPGPASAASRPCPRTGATLATSRTDDGSSRIWRTRGRTFGCTTIGNDSGRPETWLLSRRAVGRVRLDGETAAWTSHAAGSPARTRRVSAIELTSGHRFLNRRRALPATSDGAPEREGSVDQLRVLRGNFVGWIADGSTVALGVEDPDDVAIAGEDEATGDIYLSGGKSADGYDGIARSYPSSAAGDRSLRDSLSIAIDDADPDDDGRYTTTWSWSPDGATTVRAEMTGNR